MIFSLEFARKTALAYNVICKPVKGDRRKMELYCTEKAETIIGKGRKLQDDFSEGLLCGLEEETRETFFEAIKQMDKNLDVILKEEK